MSVFFSTVWLVSLNGLVFKILNFVQTKGTAVLTFMFTDVHLLEQDEESKLSISQPSLKNWNIKRYHLTVSLIRLGLYFCI